mgnify:CR=1 FL=1
MAVADGVADGVVMAGTSGDAGAGDDGAGDDGAGDDGMISRRGEDDLAED